MILDFKTRATAWMVLFHEDPLHLKVFLEQRENVSSLP